VCVATCHKESRTSGEQRERERRYCPLLPARVLSCRLRMGTTVQGRAGRCSAGTKQGPSVRQPLSESESRAAAAATASRALPLGRAASPCPSLADGEPATVTWPSVRSPSPSPGHLSPSSPGRPYHANSDGVRWPSHSPQQKHHTIRHRLLGRSGTQGQYQAGTSPSVGRSSGHRRAGAPRRQPITVHSHGARASAALASFPPPPGAVWCSSCVDRHRHVLVEIDSGATATPHPHAWVQQVDVDPRA
jgi:hypothetical protein